MLGRREAEQSRSQGHRPLQVESLSGHRANHLAQLNLPPARRQALESIIGKGTGPASATSCTGRPSRYGKRVRRISWRPLISSMARRSAAMFSCPESAQRLVSWPPCGKRGNGPTGILPCWANETGATSRATGTRAGAAAARNHRWLTGCELEGDRLSSSLSGEPAVSSTAPIVVLQSTGSLRAGAGRCCARPRIDQCPQLRRVVPGGRRHITCQRPEHGRLLCMRACNCDRSRGTREQVPDPCEASGIVEWKRPPEAASWSGRHVRLTQANSEARRWPAATPASDRPTSVVCVA